MLFNSYAFIILLLVTFFLYYLPFLSKYQVELLIIASLIFYSFHQPVLVFLLIFSVLINTIASYLVVYGSAEKRKFFAVLGVVLNLAVLCFFKYSPLFAKTFFNPASSAGEFIMTIPLPIGISFFTFQGISLVVDVFKGKHVVAGDIVPVSFVSHARRIFLFISFFPQLISGPIVKAHEFLPQFAAKKLGNINWEGCFRNLVIGYFLKMVVADNLKDFTFWMTYPFFESHATLPLLMMLFGYSCQIFSDFAGYSLIAIGLAGLFGYNFKPNFNFPYISTSIREFWKRWHISLSTFLMEYLYFPLGGNRKGKFRTYINLMITMLLGGLWHGAAWSYMVWGGVHGLALSVERFFQDKLKIKKNVFISFMRGVGVFSFVTMTWLLFKLPEFQYVLKYLRAIYTNFGLGRVDIVFYILIYSIPVIIYHSVYLLQAEEVYVKFRRIDFAMYGLMIFMILTNSGTPGAFIYFQF